MSGKMMTFSGKRVDPLNLKPEDVCIEDIAHHLALVLRFGGATKWPYSVARHSYLASFEGMPGDPLTNLLHDAAEAYIGDIVRGVKSRIKALTECGLGTRTYPMTALERNIMKTIYFGLGLEQPKEDYHEADEIMLSAEAKVLMRYPMGFAELCERSTGIYRREFLRWGRDMAPRIPRHYDWRQDKQLFLSRYYQLTGRT